MHSSENKTGKSITLGPLKWESINTSFYKTVANVSTTFSLWQGLWKEKYLRPWWIKKIDMKYTKWFMQNGNNKRNYCSIIFHCVPIHTWDRSTKQKSSPLNLLHAFDLGLHKTKRFFKAPQWKWVFTVFLPTCRFLAESFLLHTCSFKHIYRGPNSSQGSTWLSLMSLHSFVGQT